jgi:preprotein translocase subunit SecE
MARDRQRAKQRQAERRARRLADQERAPREPDASAPLDSRRTAEPAVEDPRAAPPAPGIDPDLAVGAPPHDLGRSDEVLEDEPEVLESEDGAAAEAAASEAAEYAPRGRRGDEPAAPSRPRVVQFLTAVWAELQRVQWPDRQALTTLTGVVLGFVLIAGGYLGLLDAIVSRLIEAIL